MLTVPAVVLGLLPFALSQSNNRATCQSGFEWSFNSDNQSPCDVAASLAGVCSGGQFSLAPLGDGFVYLGPNSDNANSCRCSSVYYSLLSACAVCQKRSFIRWTAYNTNCTTVYSQVFAQPLPQNVKVPNWAYLDVETSDTFNATLAQSTGGPESTRLPTAPTGVPGASTSGTASSTNVGAIAGGVVGGVVALLLIAAGVFFCLRRRKAAAAPPPTEYAPAMPSEPSMAYTDAQTIATSYIPSTPMHTDTPPPGKIYDPNDPSTFPAALAGGEHHTGSTGFNPYAPPHDPYMQHPQPQFASNITPQFSGNNYQSPRPHYTGAPEL